MAYDRYIMKGATPTQEDNQKYKHSIIMMEKQLPHGGLRSNISRYGGGKVSLTIKKSHKIVSIIQLSLIESIQMPICLMFYLDGFFFT
jgi:hypothetical protein